jgi:hypothetical protein
VGRAAEVRLRLEYDDHPVFSTFRGTLGEFRALAVRIKGKPFVMWRSIDRALHFPDEEYMRAIDNDLVASMERVLTKVFLDACAAVPEGVDLLTTEEK